MVERKKTKGIKYSLNLRKEEKQVIKEHCMMFF